MMMMIVLPETKVVAVDQMDRAIEIIGVVNDRIGDAQPGDLLGLQTLLGTALDMLAPVREMCNALQGDERAVKEGTIGL